MEALVERQEAAERPPEILEVQLAEQTRELKPGEICELLSDVPDADVIAHHWCQIRSFKLLSAERQGAQWRLRIQRVKGHSAPVQLVGRREALRRMAGALFAGLALSMLSRGRGEAQEASQESAVENIKLPELPPPQPNEDVLIRMMRDLQRALKKPMEQRRWVMVIDLRKCVGCHACTIACIAENKLPPGVVYRPVMEEEIGEYPHVTRRFLPRPCMQCENPPCVPVCPVKATWKRADGITVVDYDACIGCRYCIIACPYGARTFDFGEYYTADTPQMELYEKMPNFEYHQQRKREKRRFLGVKLEQSPMGNVRKCHFCIHRIERGLLPQCVTTCIGRATYFGDANDPESLVAELIAKPNVMRLKEELGTEPRVYYLM